MHSSPNILRSSFCRQHEQSKKGVIKELFSEIGVFLVKLQTAKIWKILKKIGQIRKSWSVKMEHFFRKKRHSEILVCEIFSRSPKLGARSPAMLSV